MRYRGRKPGVEVPGVVQGPMPIIILVEPQMGENIGAAARAMLNFGLDAMRLVAPRDGWPNPAAKAMSAGASKVIDSARVFATLEEAVADCTYVAATTARGREMRLPIFSPQEAAKEMAQRLYDGEECDREENKAKQYVDGERCAVLFGPERSGLTSNHIAMADAILSIPVNPDFASLNLAQAVLLFAYEWGQYRTLPMVTGPLDEEKPAKRDEFDRMMAHLTEELDAAGFFYPPEKKILMERNLRVALARAGLTHIEVQTFRGVIKALAKGRGKCG